MIEAYRKMVLIRRFELKAQDLYRRGSIPGFIHLYVGEEAVAVGICLNLKADDYVTSTHRGHGHALAKGIPPKEVMAELWGRSTGCSGGRGGSMHLYDPTAGFLGTNGMVAAGIPMAAGAALAGQLRGSDQVAVAFFGDGAVNHGAFHEGINLAAAWNLPVVFVCENNLYATETPFATATRNRDVASRGAAYGIPSESVDGNDVEAVWAAAKRAVSRARAGEGPTLVECRTYRLVGHHEGDPGSGYRSKEEVEAWRRRCPITSLRAKALEEHLASEADLNSLEDEVDSVLADAVRFADASPWPDAAEAFKHVFPDQR
ncbi:MAG: thiamine pyrophosphate-dependent enzyme [Bryobacteraceae bacterium]